MNPVLKGLQPYFQQQFDRNKETISAEILMRSPLGCISDVVKILEGQNQIHHLDLLAFSHALKWSKTYGLPCSSNFSARSLSRRKVVEQIIISDPLCQIKLELTENRDLSAIAINNLKYLKNYGFKISLDDYGSQYNGLNRFVKIGFNEIKIDRYLIHRIGEQIARAAIKSTVFLGNNTGCTVVAEGVETSEQFESLKELGIEVFQGFFYSEPKAFKPS